MATCMVVPSLMVELLDTPVIVDTCWWADLLVDDANCMLYGVEANHGVHVSKINKHRNIRYEIQVRALLLKLDVISWYKYVAFHMIKRCVSIC